MQQLLLTHLIENMSVWSNFCLHRGVLISGLIAIIFQTIIMSQNQVESKEFTSSLQNDITDISMLYSENKKYVIYRNTNKKECYIDDVLIANQSLKESKYSRTLFVGAKIDSSHKLYPEIGQDVIEFCKEYTILLLEERPPNRRKIDSNFTRKELKRIRRETSNSGSKRSVPYRGQAQTQFISLDGGNEKAGGVAEAFAEPDRSQARVSGTIGMGQAQSQSGNYNCEECISTKTVVPFNISGPWQQLTVTKSLDKINVPMQTEHVETKVPNADAGFQQIPQSTITGSFIHNPEIQTSSNTTEKQLGVQTQLPSGAVGHPIDEQKPFRTVTYDAQSIDSRDRYPTITSSIQPSTSTIEDNRSYAVNPPYYSKTEGQLFPSNQQESIPDSVRTDQLKGKQSFIPIYQPESSYYSPPSSGRTVTTEEGQKYVQPLLSITQPSSSADQAKTDTKKTLQSPLPLPSQPRILTGTTPVLSPFASPTGGQIPMVKVNPSKIPPLLYPPAGVQSQVLLPQPTTSYKYPAEGMEIISSAPSRPSSISDAAGTQTPVKLPQLESSQTIIQPGTQQTNPNQFTSSHSLSPIQLAHDRGMVPPYSQFTGQQQIYTNYPQQQPIQSANRPYYSENHPQNAVNGYRQIYHQPSLHYANYPTDRLQTGNYPSTSGIKMPFFDNQDYPGTGYPTQPLKAHFDQTQPQQHHTQQTYIDQTRQFAPQYSTFPNTGSGSSYVLTGETGRSTSIYPGASTSFSTEGESNSQIPIPQAGTSRTKGSSATFPTSGVSSSQTPTYETESRTVDKYPTTQYSPGINEARSKTTDEYYPKYSSGISASNPQVPTPGAGSRATYEYQLQNSPEITKTSSKTVNGYSPQYSPAVSTISSQVPQFGTGAKTADGYPLQYSPGISTSGSQIPPTFQIGARTADGHSLPYSPGISTSSSQVPALETGAKTADGYPLQYSPPGISTSGSQIPPTFQIGARTTDGHSLPYSPGISASGSQIPLPGGNSRTTDGYPSQHSPVISTNSFQVPSFGASTRTTDENRLQYSPQTNANNFKVPIFGGGSGDTSSPQGPIAGVGSKTGDEYSTLYSPEAGQGTGKYSSHYFPSTVISPSPITGGTSGVDTSQGTLLTLVDSESGDAQSMSSINIHGNDTKATASSQGKTKNGKAQSQVSGTYTGSFSAQAQTSDNEKSVESQIFGNSSGAISSSQGRAGKSNSQSQIRYNYDTGTTSAESQGNGINYTMNSQIQAGLTGGIADAQSSGPGSTSSQAQIGFLPYDDSKKDQQSFFDGGGTASAQSDSLSGQSETQLRGTFQYGVSYSGAAQSAAGRSIQNITRPSLNTSNFSLPQGITLKKILNDQRNTKNLSDKYVPNNNNNYNDNLSTNNSLFTLTNSTSTVKAYESNINATSSSPSRYSLIDTTTIKSEADNDRVPTEPRDLSKEDDTEGTTDSDNDDDYYEKKEYQNKNKKKSADFSLYPIAKSKNKIENKTPMTQTQNTFIRTRNHDVHVTRDSTNSLKEGDIFQPGQVIPSTNSYTVPRGFRGRITSVAGDKTEANAYPGSQAQAQTIIMKPGGSGKLFVTDKSKDLYFVPTDQHRKMHGTQSSNRNPYDAYVTVTKSETGELNNGDKKYSHTYYTKSSTCGYFTFSCNVIEGKNGRTKICTPNAPTTADGTPC